MNRRSIIGLSTVAALGFALYSSHAVGQSAKDLVGTWTIVSAEAFGPNPKGLLIFQPDGRYSLMLTFPSTSQTIVHRALRRNTKLSVPAASRISAHTRSADQI
jgi:Lipocalin-like domain